MTGRPFTIRVFTFNAVIEEIKNNGQILAVIIRASFQQKGIEFFTPGDFSQQLGYINRQKGYTIEPHVHKPVERQVVLTQEVLFIKSGRVRVDFYAQNQSYVDSLVLETGDVILLAAGGHGFEMLEDAEMIEVKQGPYCGDEDKVRFVPQSNAAVATIT